MAPGGRRDEVGLRLSALNRSWNKAPKRARELFLDRIGAAVSEIAPASGEAQPAG